MAESWAAELSECSMADWGEECAQDWLREEVNLNFEMEDPTPDGDEIVEIQRCGICGSDVYAYVEGWKYAPSVCGHEWVGTVAASGGRR